MKNLAYKNLVESFNPLPLLCRMILIWRKCYDGQQQEQYDSNKFHDYFLSFKKKIPRKINKSEDDKKGIRLIK